MPGGKATGPQVLSLKFFRVILALIKLVCGRMLGYELVERQ
jgi:hypothetical protein